MKSRSLSSCINSLALYILYGCFLFSEVMDFVECQGAKRGNRKSSGSKKGNPQSKIKPKSKNAKPPGSISESHITGIYFCAILFLLCFVPSIIMFIFNVVRDPLTPTLISNASDIMKARTFSYLSKSRRNAAAEDSKAE
jgi:hypothetical protein